LNGNISESEILKTALTLHTHTHNRLSLLLH